MWCVNSINGLANIANPDQGLQHLPWPICLNNKINGPHCDKTCLLSFKPVASATETSEKIEISPIARLNKVLSKKGITKALIRLRRCAGWSASVLFENPQRQVFSRRGPNIIVSNFVCVY